MELCEEINCLNNPIEKLQYIKKRQNSRENLKLKALENRNDKLKIMISVSRKHYQTFTI